MSEVLRAMIKLGDDGHGVCRPLQTEFVIELARRGAVDRHRDFERYKGDIVPTPTARHRVSLALSEMTDRGLISHLKDRRGLYYVTREGREVLGHFDDVEADALVRGTPRPAANSVGGAGVGRRA